MRDLADTSDAPRTEGDVPDFEAWDDPEHLFEGETIKERLLDVIVQLREPTTVATVADRADCDTETARNYLQWFGDLGLVTEHSGRPIRYERNESFLRWRRIEQIRRQYSPDEIVSELQEVMSEIEAYRERFDAETPGAVSLTEASTETSIDAAWKALSDWQTLEQRGDLLDAARRDTYRPRGANSVDA